METVLDLIVPALKISIHPTVKASSRPVVRDSREVAEIFRQIWNTDMIQVCEEMWLLVLNTKGRVLGSFQLSRGGVTQCTVDPKILFSIVLGVAGATGFVVCHNHPSGDLQPSRADGLFTQQIKIAAMALDLKFLDHIILAADSYLSMADEGLI